MNDPNKAINVNLSSLLSLKAELLRKQNEVKVAKSNNTNSDEFATNKSKSNSEELKKKKKERIKANEQTENVKVYETEDSAQLEKSRRVLESKSKYYDRMSRAGGSLNSDDNCLVMFNRKRQEGGSVQEQRVIVSSSESDDDHDDAKDTTKEKYNEDDVEDEDDWVEFTDCLGRTRTCLRKDLADAKRRDKELADSMPERLDQTKANWMIDTKGTLADNNSDDEDTYGPKPTESIYSEGLSTMSKLEEQRVNWERKEQENFERPDVHYQDVFFDEARMHGVGYYAFSTDETERKKQQKDLDVARKATLAEQKKRDTLRAERDKLVTERVFAAKNRIRARNGLPPITKEEFEKEYKTPKEHEHEEKTKKMERKERKRTEKQLQAREQEDAEREHQRQEHVRPWDKEKVGVAKSATTNPEGIDGEQEEEWQYKAERLPMSQAEWNEQQRSMRIQEFAPTPELAPEQIMPKRTNFTCMLPPPPPAPAMARMHSGTEFAPFQSTKRTFQRRNYMADVDHMSDEVSSSTSQRGAAIPPPDNLDTDYALPAHAKRPKTSDELARSIEAGLRFLRDQSDKGHPGKKASWSAKADY